MILLLSMSLIACSNESVEGNETVSEEVSEENETVSEKATEADEEDAETSEEEEVDPINVRVAGLKGPTSMGMIQLFEEYVNPADGINFEYVSESAPDLLVGKLIKGELDFAAVPTNLASIIYNKTEGKYQLTNINTLNVLYVLTNGSEVKRIQDLKGKTIHVSGKGATPDYMIRYLLTKNGLDPENDVTLDFSLDHASLAQAITAGDVEIALLPQPFVTSVQLGNPDVEIGIDLLEAWENVAGEALFAMGGLVVRTEFANAHPDIVKDFLDAYQQSVTFVNENPEKASLLVEKYGVLPKAKLAEVAIPKSNIVYMDAFENQTAMEEYYSILLDFNKASIGGKLPGDDFYYKNK